MANVIINDEHLIAIGDSLRSKLGETKVEKTATQYPLPLVEKTANATGHDSLGSATARYNTTYVTYAIPGAVSIKVKSTVNFDSSSCFLRVASGTVTSGSSGTNLYTSVYTVGESQSKEVTFENTDTVTIIAYYRQAFYIEIFGLDADGNEMAYYESYAEQEVANTFKPRDMAGAIDKLLAPDAIELFESYHAGYDDLIEGGYYSEATYVRPYAFYDMGILGDYEFPNVEWVDQYAFYNNYYGESVQRLTNFIAPNLKKIGTSAFMNCYALQSITLENVTHVYGTAFNSCYSLKEAILPNVYDFTAGRQFWYCRSLEKVDLGTKVDGIGYNTFYECTVLETLIIRNPDAVIPLASTGAFTNTPIANGTGYIYVPQALKNDYVQASNWSTYSAQFRAIESYPGICG